MSDELTIQGKMNLAWRLRFLEENERCMTALTELKRDLQLPYGRIRLEILDAQPEVGSATLVSEVLLLAASLERAQGRLTDSNRMIAVVEAYLKQSDVSATCHLLFQKGISSFQYGDYSVALEQFLSALSLADASWVRCYLLTYAVLCMGYLAIPYEGTLQRLRDEMEAFVVENFYDDQDLKKIERHLMWVDLWKWIWNGRFDLMFSEENRKRFSLESITDLEFCLMYCAELPYHPFTVRNGLEFLTMAKPNLQRKSYRIRTLQGYLHPEDSLQLRPASWVSRLYLWVWRWMVDPEGFPVSRIMRLIDKMDLSEMVHRLSAEDSQRIRNALRWLSLFDSTSRQTMDRLLKVIQVPGTGDYPLYEIENLTIHFLSAWTQNDDQLAEEYYQVLRNHPLWSQESLFFRPLVDGVRREEALVLNELTDNLIELRRNQRLDLVSGLVLRTAVFTVRNLNTREEVISEPMTKALQLFREHDAVPADQLLAHCFGIVRYDSLIHNTKIFNLLARMRGLASGLVDFSLRSGVVYREGNWNEVHVIETPSVHRSLGEQPAWKELLFRKRDPDESLASSGESPSVQELMKRKDIERLIKKSRSTASRVLSRWEDQGLVTKEGSARSTRYRLSSALLERLKSGLSEIGEVES